MSNIPNPWRYENKWLVWPDTTLENLHLSDCNDTVKGFCLENKNLEQCISECNKGCAAGYLIEVPDNKTICVPIRQALDADSNPVHRLRPKSIYPELDRTKITTFINTDVYPFPPKSANAVFYRDILSIKETKNNMSIGTESNKIDGKDIIFMDKSNDDNLQIIQTKVASPQISKYRPVRYGDPVQLSVPGTNLMARSSSSFPGMLQWLSTPNMIDGTDFSFRIIPTDTGKKEGDIISYADTFSIVYNDISTLIINYSNNSLHLQNYDNKNTPSTFQFVCKMDGYYCDNGECKKIPMLETTMDGLTAYYKGSMVTRDSACWGLCKNDNMVLSTTGMPPQGKNDNTGLIVLIVLLILFFLGSLLTIYFK